MSAPLWHSADAEAATDGRSSAPWAASGVSIDSRTVEPGDLFVALTGETHDGHDHVAQAFAKDAAAAMVARDPAGLERAGAPLLRVNDTLAGLRALGAFARARSRARIVAVTGSVGKTGTKEALRLALSAQGETHASAASYNNQFGVPLSLARMGTRAAFGVFEIGMNHAGEISPLTRLVRPHVAIITTVEAVHVENFPETGIDGVALAKSEIFDGLTGGIAVLNRDNRFFDFLVARARAAGAEGIVSFGAHRDADARLIASEPTATGSQVTAMIHAKRMSYRLGAPGRHWVLNSLAVLAAIGALGADVGAGAAALVDLTPPKGRGKRYRLGRDGEGYELIDDSYNASPASMRASFEVLATSVPGAQGRRIAVLGDMLELGPESLALHVGLKEPLIGAHVDKVFTCGRFMSGLHDALPAAMRGGHAASSDQLLALVKSAIRGGDVVVVKGSLGSRMGRIVEALIAGNGTTHPPDRLKTG